MRRHFLLLMLTCMALLFARPARAATDPAVVVRTAVDQVFEVLRDPALKKAEKRAERLAKVRVIADRVFHWESIAQSSLGPTYRTINDAQRKEFVSLFANLIAAEYRDDMDRFMGDEKVLVKGVEAREADRIVKTILVTHSGDQVPVDYFMSPEGESWRAHDFSVEGVSLVNHYRKSFARYLANHTFEELLERLRSRAKPE